MIGWLLAIAVIVLAFVMMPASVMAALLRYFLPALMAASGIVLAIAGRPAIGAITLIASFFAFRAVARSAKRAAPPVKPKRTVRSAALECEMDGDGAPQNGIILAGRFEGRTLDDMARADLLRLREEIDADEESMALLDAYLDRRFPTWREDAELDGPAG